MSVIERLERLRQIAGYLSEGVPLADKDVTFVSEALVKIANGEDPRLALDIKAKRGERTSIISQEKQTESQVRKVIALGWLSVAMAPEEEGGLGLTLDQAVGKVGENAELSTDQKAFDLTEETLKTYWAKHPEMHDIIFKLPD